MHNFSESEENSRDTIRSESQLESYILELRSAIHRISNMERSYGRGHENVRIAIDDAIAVASKRIYI